MILAPPIIPEPLPWLPLAVGAKVSLAVVVIIICSVLIKAVLRYRSNRYRRLALKQLALLSLHQQHLNQTPLHKRAVDAELSLGVILKRCAIAARHPKHYQHVPQCQHLIEPDFIDWLNACLKRPLFTSSDATLLAHITYSPAFALAPNKAGVDDAEIKALIDKVRVWIKQHQLSHFNGQAWEQHEATL